MRVLRSMEWIWLWVLVLVVLLGGGCECEGCFEQDKTALLQLKPFFSHIDDVENYWVEGKQSRDCCEWERVECNTSTGRVIRLFLNQTYTITYADLAYIEYNDFYADLAYSKYDDFYAGYFLSPDHWHFNASLLLPFEELNSLYLSGNSIAGCVDNHGFEMLSSKLKKLEFLDLTLNYFNDSILASLSEFSSLKSLYLGRNQFTGSNPSDGIKKLLKLNKLELLDLHGNMLGNNVLSYLRNFTSLKSLRLQNCGLNGTIDMLEFDNLINLKELYLAYNEITSLGSLFQRKGQLRFSKLEVLGLSSNLFNNSIFSSLDALSNLKSLYLRSNRLEGPIQIKDLNALSNLEELDMWYNHVSNIVPSQDNETKLQLTKLKVLDLRWNSFNSSSSILSSLDALSNLEELYISCAFAGETSMDCNLSLQSLDIFSSLKTLSLVGFSVKETSNTTRSSLDLKNLESLEIWEASLENNFLEKIGTMPSLRFLRLFYCGLNGTLETQGSLDLKNLESLAIWGISLKNNFLEKIGTMPSLKFLRLRGCELNGTLDTKSFCGLTNLQELYVSYNNLTGSLPECFSNFTSLKSLRLYSNKFFGNISALESLISLESLDLSFNQFSGSISALKSLKSLESLDLSSNQFSGNISALKSLKSLQYLILSNNYFKIPISLRPLFGLSKLHHIDADNNTIYAEPEMRSVAPKFQLQVISLSCCGDVGSFPQFLYHLHDLRYVDLSNLYFKGEQFPNWLLENNTNLHTLVLANNSLLGPFRLPFHSHMEFSHLDISQNSFYDNIPNEIGAKLPSLQFLNMSKNYFVGNIPDSIGDMNSLYTLDLSNNKLTGGVPEHLAMGCSSLMVLILSNNRLQGKMFSSNFNLTKLEEFQLNQNFFTGGIPDCLSKCSFLSTLDISSNQISGEIPGWMKNLSSLSTLDLSNNKLVGEIPRWMGNMTNLEEIVMAKNHLEGPIPMEFCQLNLNLKLLDLSVNNISGSLPSCFNPLWISQVHLSRNKLQGPLKNAFSNSTILVTLDLSNNNLTGNIPKWIGRLSQLSYLLLNNNQFEGGISVQLCKLGHLSLIDLSNNNFSGTIPPCLKITTLYDISQDYVRYVAAVAQAPSSFSTEEPIQFTTKNISYTYKGRVLALMSGIDLSCNKLTGEIPHEVKNFQKIHVLNLSHNSLSGPIPPSISNLKQIESLDLSHNNLSGKIPSQLVGLNYLSFFSVAYNNLSGSTPDRTAQFATFEESSYHGNPFLCGAPLTKNCSKSRQASSMSKASIDNGSIDMNVLYVSFVVSYVMVLIAIATVLYINPYWRRAWFYHLEAATTSCYYFLEDYILPKRFHCGNI